MCNCNRNGKTNRDFLTPVVSATAEGTNYVLGLTYNTCGNRKMLQNDPTHPVLANLTASVVGTPQDLGNGAFCCEVQIAGTVTYKPCCSCSPRTEYVFDQFCIPCESAVVPSLTLGKVVCAPQAITYYDGCCPCTNPLTNKIAITTSLNVATEAAAGNSEP